MICMDGTLAKRGDCRYNRMSRGEATVLCDLLSTNPDSFNVSVCMFTWHFIINKVYGGSARNYHKPERHKRLPRLGS
jgi:hypothetical protein